MLERPAPRPGMGREEALMIALENCLLDAVVLDADGNAGRVRLRDGSFLPGVVYVEPYRAVRYGFVAADGMDGVSYLGEALGDGVRLQDPRLVDAVARAADWRNGPDGDLVEAGGDWADRKRGLAEFPVPALADAVRDLRLRKVTLTDLD